MRWLVLIFFLPVWAFAQTGEAFQPASAYSSVSEGNTSLLATPFPQFNSLVKRLEAKKSRFKSDKDFLAYIFKQTHQRLLKSYEDNASYQELIDKGSYNCLTGTTVYALLLDQFSYTYSIIETNYHIFLIVNTQSGQVLLETTDPLNGFTDRDEDIQTRIAGYRENKITTAARQDQYYFSFAFYREVTLYELEGLLYYNEAIRAFNAKQFDTAIIKLEKAYTTYYSARIDEFSKVLLVSVAGNEQLSLSEKASYIKQLRLIRKSGLEMNASR